jgi:ribonuclease HI
MKIQAIYTDGACSGNPGPGGWGTLVVFEDGSVHEMGGGDRQTTNNRMEMQAAIAALEYLKATGQTQPVLLYTDSQYLINGITQWINGWKRKGWKTSSGGAVLNQELWQALDALRSPAPLPRGKLPRCSKLALSPKVRGLSKGLDGGDKGIAGRSPPVKA